MKKLKEEHIAIRKPRMELLVKYVMDKVRDKYEKITEWVAVVLIVVDLQRKIRGKKRYVARIYYLENELGAL